MYFQLRGWLEQVVEIGQKQDSERRVEILGFPTLLVLEVGYPPALVSVIWDFVSGGYKYWLPACFFSSAEIYSI